MNSGLQGGFRQAFRCLLLVVTLAAVSWPTQVSSGNFEMVEQRTEELDEVNRQAVARIPEELPAQGVIELEAEIVGKGPEASVEIKDHAIRRGQIPRNNQARAGDKAAEGKGRISPSSPARP